MKAPAQEVSLKQYFIPLTTSKAIFWLCLVGSLVFFTMLFNGFVWDDLVFIINNTEVHTVNILTSFGKNYFNNSGYYRPIPELYFSILYGFFGQAPAFYHGVQLILHIVCTLLLFLLYKKFFTKPIAFIVSLLFLVHPINVESVSYIAASQSELVFLPGIAALLLVVNDNQSKKKTFPIFLLLLLSLLTKETGFVFIVLVLFYTLLFKREKMVEYVTLSLSSIVIYAWLRFGVAQVFFEKMGYAPISHLSFVERLRSMPSIIYYYIKTVFFPWKLAIDQQWMVTTVTFQSFYLPLIVDSVFLVTIGWIGVYLYRKDMKSFLVYFFFLTWFLCSSVFLLQLFPLDMTVADRWFYVPLVGLLGIFGAFIQQVKPAHKQKVSVCLGIVILLFSLRTVVRNSDWYNLMTLYSHDTAIEDSFDNENNYGVILVQNGDIHAAIPHLLKANTLYPTEFSLRNTGMVYLTLHENAKALSYLEKAMKTKSYVLPPHHHQTATYDSFGRYYLITKEYKKAVSILEEGVTDYPDAHTLWYLQAIAHELTGNKSRALVAAEKAYTLYNSPETSSLYTALKNNLPLPITISN